MNFERGSPEYMAWLQSRAEELNRLIGAVSMTEAESERAEAAGGMITTFVPTGRAIAEPTSPIVRRFPSWRIRLIVVWGYEGQHIELSAGHWLNVLAGQSLERRGPNYGYEGKVFSTWWEFDGGLDGDLTVSYSNRHDSAIGFRQSLSNAKATLWSVASDGIRPASQIFLDRDRIDESRNLLATLPHRDRVVLLPEARRQERTRLEAACRRNDPRYEGWTDAQIDFVLQDYAPKELTQEET
jgi:hypothetical protein